MHDLSLCGRQLLIVDIDDCEPKPCQHGGTCQDEINSYTCDCAPGTMGDNCEIDIDDCDPNPCQHGGTCQDEINSYTCVCAPGTMGDNCEIDIDDCEPNPCQHDGTCQDGINSYTCDCAPGTMGDNCEIDQFLTTSPSRSSTEQTTPAVSTGNPDSTGNVTSGTTRASPDTSGSTRTTSTTTATDTTGASPTTSGSTSNTPTTTGEPSVATWLPWNDWLPCSVTCGSGIHRRYRSCKDGAFTCEGDFIETAMCKETSCPVYGKWTTWESWGSCSTSCDRGIQLRTRSCNTTDPNALDCVGNDHQNRTCSDWKCPDCNQECSIGILNSECDACICENNNVTGHVISEITRSFLGNVFVYAITAPTTVLAQTNKTGYFTLDAMCESTELLIVKEGYVDKIVTMESNNFEVKMTKIELPYFTQTPRPKYRLEGETVTLCCTAVATPGIEYYEWFKDSLLIETVESTDATTITLQDLVPLDSGNYQCRANNRHGAVMSPAARLDVKENPDAFCKNALQPKFVSLPDGCVNPDTNSALYDEGECVAHSCRLNESNNDTSCEIETYSCCAMSESVIRTVQCTDYEVQLFVVRACGCAECIAPSLGISGTVVDFEDNSPVRFAEVWANGVFQMRTSYSGGFYFEPSKSIEQINIFIVDTYQQQYLSTTKVFRISSDMTGTLSIDIKLFKASDPVELDSAEINTLVAGTSEEGSAVVEVDIPSNAFRKVDGTPYNGTVVAGLTFLDPTNITQLEDIPGAFEFTDAEGQQGALDTYGVFNLQFTDSDGQPIALGESVDLYAPNGLRSGDDNQEIKLWRLNTKTGKWDYVPPSSDVRRRKRQSLSTFIGSINPDETSVNWWNYDVARSMDNDCYFKVRLFQGKDLTNEITNPSPHVNVHSISSPNNSVRIINDFVYNTNERCISAICDNNNAYITAFDYRKNYKTYLYAAEPISNSDVEFTIADDKKSLKVKMERSPDGPFFENMDVCLNSSKDNPHLRWYYDLSTGDWEVLKKFTFWPNVTDEQNGLRALKTWYPERIDGYKACYLKVRLEFLYDYVFDDLNVTLKLKTTSFGGSEPVAGEVFGGRVVEIQTVENQTICIEFKCSGSLINPFSPETTDVTDYTRVKVEFDHPMNSMECTMTGSAGLSKHVSDAAQSGTIGGVYMLTAPKSEFDSGVYLATQNDITEANNLAYSMCHSGTDASETVNPILGVGVTFTCRPLCQHWYYYSFNFWYWYYYFNDDICDFY